MFKLEYYHDWKNRVLIHIPVKHQHDIFGHFGTILNSSKTYPFFLEKDPERAEGIKERVEEAIEIINKVSKTEKVSFTSFFRLDNS